MNLGKRQLGTLSNLAGRFVFADCRVGPPRRHGHFGPSLRDGQGWCTWQRHASSSHADGFRVVTYNVLSPALCSAQAFPHCDPMHLDAEIRWTGVLRQLESALVDAPGPTVFCLQEVNESWASRLHVHFQRRGYHLVYAATPWAYYDPMGVCIAWPNDAFELEDTQICRVVDYTPVASGMPKSHFEKCLLWFRERIPFLRPVAELDARLLACRRPNRYASVRLRFLRTSRSVCIATYHMPALFGNALNDQAMALHASAVVRLACQFAGGLPLVLAGDFNVEPGSAVYELILGGGSSPADTSAISTDNVETQAVAPVSEHWSLRSAYADADGHEPKFTIRSWRNGFDRPFIGTLDYVFVSDGVLVRGVRELPSGVGSGVEAATFPSHAEPSDHILLAADLTLDAPPPG